jgi:hypothetical protein
MKIQEAIDILEKNYELLPQDEIYFIIGYATAINDLRHLAEDEDIGDMEGEQK